MDLFDEDLLGDAAPERHLRVAADVADEERAAEDGLAVEPDDVVLVEAQGHEPTPDPFSAGQIDDPEKPVERGFDERHDVLLVRTVVPSVFGRVRAVLPAGNKESNYRGNKDFCKAEAPKLTFRGLSDRKW
jgi:hypothetical protein